MSTTSVDLRRVLPADVKRVFEAWRSTRPAATLVSQETRYQLKLGPLGALMDALMMRRRLDGGIRQVFENLKRYVESPY